MKVKAPFLLALVLAVAVLGQASFVRVTATHTANQKDQLHMQVVRVRTGKLMW